MGKPKMNVRIPNYQAERNKKVRAVRKATGKAQQHKERVKSVSGLARSKKSQKRAAHRTRMLERHDAEAEARAAGGDAAMAEAASEAARRSGGLAVGGKKQGLKLKRRKGGGGGAGAAAAAAGAGAEAGAAAEGEGMQERTSASRICRREEAGSHTGSSWAAAAAAAAGSARAPLRRGAPTAAMVPPAAAPVSKQAQTQAEEDAAINVRLLTHVAATLRGKEPLFKAVSQSFLAVVDAAVNGTGEDAAAAEAAFVQDMDVLELQLNRFQSANEANEREQQGYAAKQRQLEGQIARALEEIEGKKRELQDARVVRQHNEEYEVVRALIAAQPQRATTQAAIDAEQARIESLRAEQRRHEATLEQKRRAFALLLQCIEDLQRAGDDDGGGDGGGGGPSAMQIDG
ncbi:THO complex subunit 7A-like [Raphidocelis subcapitata]|uniref:THO complex subunit 7A-like n=1 Tax=Raphidocelis subcapitata TaxID=307507 RepID=A0A2V0PB70_9CHLO|nr:THO complex subunit 7A-like [Raphidocelis subcapitata]|eukprot:GBF97108.1 THO complex subunit 7A-like [Raphidocelis subcapitata]